MTVIRDTCPSCGGLKEKRAKRCRKCYFVWRRTYEASLERILARISIRDTGCWEWMGAVSDGYGNASVNGHSIKVHRFLYENLVGKIQQGYEPDHLCRNRRCVNPDHLEIVTHGENVRRGNSTKKRQFCHRGHPFDEENTHINKAGGRVCRECNRQRVRRQYWKLKEEVK